MIAGDFTGDGKLDLIVSSADDDEIAVFLGNGNGTFQPPKIIAIPILASSLATGDFNGDNKLDLAVGSGLDGPIDVLLGNGDGTFRLEPTINTSFQVTSLVAGDFNGDGKLDLAASGYYAAPGSSDTLEATVGIFLGNGDGTFQPVTNYPLSFLPGYNSLLAGDFTGEGSTDLVSVGSSLLTGGSDETEIATFANNGDGTFQAEKLTVPGSGFGEVTMVAGDFNGDGRLDLASVNYDSNVVTTLLNNGDGTFSPPGLDVTTPDATPLVVDANGDGTDDVLVVDGSGDILYRQGIPGHPGTFEPPVTVNPNVPSRDIAWVPKTLEGPLLVSVDAQENAISLYGYRDGVWVSFGSLLTGDLPSQIIAANLTGTGWIDLIVRNARDGTLSVFLNNGLDGSTTNLGAPFLPAQTLKVGLGISDVQAVETTGDGRLDLVVTNELTGEVDVLENSANGTFAAPVAYRAGTGLTEIDPGSIPEVDSEEETDGMAAGPLTPGGPTDLVTINPGSNTMDVLAGLGDGRFADPGRPGDREARPMVVRMADFTGDGVDDLAVLTSAGVSIYLGNGKGGFLPPTTYAVPSESDGLTVADLTGNGKLDLLVGDAYGDVLVLMGNGDGTFQPYREANQAIELAVADLTGNGATDVIYADQGLDRVVVDYGAGSSTVLADQSTGLLDPGAVKLADLNGDGIPDLIVANSGSNNVLIYPGLGDGQFGPAINDGNGYFVGTNPVGITVADLIPGGLPDLVIADEGSNQVSILLNTSQTGGAISFEAGPRLSSGGSGPVSTAVVNLTGGPFPDLLVTNSGSNDVALLPGVGQGFFNDQNPRIYSVGTDPVTSFVGKFDGQTDLVTVNAGSNDLTIISGFEGSNAVVGTIASGGVDPTTAFDFTADDGFEDLVVGNSGDGELALYEGGDDGLDLVSVESEPDLPDPTDMAFSALTGGEVEFYAATAGREEADLVALSLSIELETGTGTGSGTSGESPSSPSAVSPTGTGEASASSPGSAQPALPGTIAASLASASFQLVALHDSSLPLVATVLMLTLEVEGEGAVSALPETEALGIVASLMSPGISAGQGSLSATRGGGSEWGPIEGSEEPGATGQERSAVLAPWERFVLGLDEALEELEREGSGGLMAPSQPVDRSGPTPRPGAPAPDGGSGMRSTPDRPGDAEQRTTDVPLSLLPIHAIDAAIARLGNDRAGVGRSLDRRDPGPRWDEPRLVRIGLVVSLITGPWGGRRRLTSRPSPRARSGSPGYRCRHVII